MLMSVAQGVRFRKASLKLAAATAELKTCHEQASLLATQQEEALQEFRAVVADVTGLNIDLGVAEHARTRVLAPA